MDATNDGVGKFVLEGAVTVVAPIRISSEDGADEETTPEMRNDAEDLSASNAMG